MRRPVFVKAMAVTTSLLLGAGIIWYQASVIRGGPAAAPAAAPAPESRTDSPGATDHPSEMAEPSIEATEPDVDIVPAQQYFSTSKSLSGGVPASPGWLTVRSMMTPVPWEDDSSDEEGKEPEADRPSYFSSSKSAIVFQPAPPPVEEADE